MYPYHIQMQSYSIDDCRQGFKSTGRQLYLGENRSLIQLFEHNLKFTAHIFCVYLWSFSQRAMMMMMMLLITLVIEH